MLREATSASNEDARLDDMETVTVTDSADLGAELDGATQETRAAAIRCSRRIPESDTLAAALSSLPLSVRDRIGIAALTHLFYSMAAGLREQSVTLEAGWRFERWGDEALNCIDPVAMAALPELYGTAEVELYWAGEPGSSPPWASDRPPTRPTTRAIAEHRLALDAIRAAPSFDPDCPIAIALDAA